MAHKAELIMTDENAQFSTESVPIKSAEIPYDKTEIESSSVSEIFCDPPLSVDRQSSDFLLSAKQSAFEVCRTAQARAGSTYNNIISVSRDVTRSARTQAEHLREERPLRLLAVIATTALVFGITARVWRSRHEY